MVIGGGIGAGKSTVLARLAAEGFHVVEADVIGHAILSMDRDVAESVMRRWPDAVADGEVSRPALAGIVFNDPAELAELEAITHPAIRSSIETVVAAHDDVPIAVEVPLMGLLGDGWVKVAVTAPQGIRIERAVARGSSEADVKARMLQQPSDAEWEAWADHVVVNDGDEGALADAVAELVRKLIP